ncbi:CRISPR-associated endonuclease Cas2 [Rhodothermus marinus]|uniref:CRISPR-associated endonuclease Cas2 n=1 Tax=Rhodothermus marinus TaxID=29549 RepID=UPI001374ADE4
MYVIMVYDVSVKRVARVLQIGRKYLTWVQNSVMEGALTQTQYQRLKQEVLKVIDKNEDSVLFYTLRSEHDLRKEILGIIKGAPSDIV